MKKLLYAGIVLLFILLPKITLLQEGILFHHFEGEGSAKTLVSIQSIPTICDQLDDVFDPSEESANDREKKITTFQHIVHRATCTLIDPIQLQGIRNPSVSQPHFALETSLHIFHRVIRV